MRYTRKRVRQRPGTKRAPRRRKAVQSKLILIDMCPRCKGDRDRQHLVVKPSDVKMTESDIAAAHLTVVGLLHLCDVCGCVWQKYRSQYDDWTVKQIGTFNGPDWIFVRYRG